MNLELWQAALLHSYIDPNYLRADIGNGFNNYMALVESAQAADQRTTVEDAILKIHDNLLAMEEGLSKHEFQQSGDPFIAILFRRRVRVREIFAWFDHKSLPVVEGWETIHSATLEQGDKWPWGNSENPDLVAMAEAMERFWRPIQDGGTFDESDRTGTNTKEAVVAWILKAHGANGVTKTSAERIDAIIRPLSRRTGGRTRSD